MIYGGDGMFYEELEEKYKEHIVFINNVIYLIRP
jgi:hypothetical protein